MLARIRKSLEEKDQGFTLIELLVVIIIIGILAAIAIPVFLNQRKKGWDASIKSDLKNAATAQETFFTQESTGYYTDAVADLRPTASTTRPTPNYDGGTALIDRRHAVRRHRRCRPCPTGTGGFCLEATSASGAVFSYDSTAGGLAPVPADLQPTGRPAGRRESPPGNRRGLPRQRAVTFGWRAGSSTRGGWSDRSAGNRSGSGNRGRTEGELVRHPPGGPTGR